MSAAASALIAGAFAAPATAPGREIDAVAMTRVIETRLNGVRGLVAQFSQTLDSAALPAPQIETGTLYLMRPGRARWEYASPAGKLAVADGQRTWLYLPEDRQVLAAPLPDPAHDEGIGLLLRERVDLMAEFQPAWGASPRKGAPRSLVLSPRKAQAAYERLVVEADADGFPIAITVLDSLGGSVTYRFTALRFVDRLQETLFQFTPPPGVPVQDVGR